MTANPPYNFSASTESPFVPRHIVVVLNPTSGRGEGTKRREVLRQLLNAAVARWQTQTGETLRWELVESTRRGEATMLAEQAAARGADVVAAAGGDGTLGEVVNGIVGTHAVLAVVPLGTGNDFARCLGIGTDLECAVETLVFGTPMWMDLGKTDDRWFCNIAGCGFDAVVADRINCGIRGLRGAPAYVAAILRSLADFRPAHLTLTLDGETRTLRAMLCSVANAPMYGGGMRIAPDARIDDGWFDVCILGDTGTWEFLRAFPRVFQGTHVSHPKVTMLRAQHVRVESTPLLPTLVDGEIIGATPSEFHLHPRAIRILCPTNEGRFRQ